MFRCTPSSLATKVYGQVFWRTTVSAAVNRTARTPLLMERPYPLGEVVRRMVATRRKLHDVEDIHERALLRGEYKFFTGKAVEMGDVATSDLVAIVDLSAFFGFWHVPLVDKASALLHQRLGELHPTELLALFEHLPRVGRGPTPLYRDVCGRLEAMAGELSLPELLAVYGTAAPPHTPESLGDALFAEIAPRADMLEGPAECVQLLHGLACAGSVEKVAAPEHRDAVHAAAELLLEPSALAEATQEHIARGMGYLATLDALDKAAATALLEAFVRVATAPKASHVAAVVETAADVIPDHALSELAPLVIRTVENMDAASLVLVLGGYARCLSEDCGVEVEDLRELVPAALNHLAARLEDTASHVPVPVVVAAAEALVAIMAHGGAAVFAAYPELRDTFRQLTAHVVRNTSDFGLGDAVQILGAAQAAGALFGDPAVLVLHRHLARAAEPLAASDRADVLTTLREVGATGATATGAKSFASTVVPALLRDDEEGWTQGSEIRSP